MLQDNIILIFLSHSTDVEGGYKVGCKTIKSSINNSLENALSVIRHHTKHKMDEI